MRDHRGQSEGIHRRARRRGLWRPDRDQRDKRLAAEAQQKALESAPTGKPVAWTNPDNGHAGTVTPVRTYQSGGTYCREFQSNVTIDGKPDKAYGTACRQPDGAWKVQS